MVSRLSDSRRRAGQYIGLTETPPKIQHDESRMKSELGSGGRTNVDGSSSAAPISETSRNAFQSRPASSTVSPPIRCLARVGASSPERNSRTSSAADQPTVYGE